MIVRHCRDIADGEIGAAFGRGRAGRLAKVCRGLGGTADRAERTALFAAAMRRHPDADALRGLLRKPD